MALPNQPFLKGKIMQGNKSAIKERMPGETLAAVLYWLAWAVLVATVLLGVTALFRALLPQLPASRHHLLAVTLDIASYAVVALALSLSLFLIAVFVKLTCRFIRAIEDIGRKIEDLLRQSARK